MASVAAAGAEVERLHLPFEGPLSWGWAAVLGALKASRKKNFFALLGAGDGSPPP